MELFAQIRQRVARDRRNACPVTDVAIEIDAGGEHETRRGDEHHDQQHRQMRAYVRSRLRSQAAMETRGDEQQRGQRQD